MNTKPFPGGPDILLIPEVGLSPNAKKSFCDYHYEMMNYYENQKL